jgi:hypothetical protein
LHWINKLWDGKDEELEEESESEVSEIESSESEEIAWTVSQKLEAKWTDGEYYYGEITRVYKNGSYGFAYTDGSKDKHRYIFFAFL